MAPQSLSDIPDVPTYRAIASDTVVSTSLGDGTALLDLRNNQYFSLADVGTIIWQSLQAPRTLDEIVDDVLAVYEVDRTDCIQDVDVLLSELMGADLVEISPPPHQ
ncbi:PqqD family protein [Devosia sp. SL43]|uniref:PqqD family protein n=1 Tax=Devosia sp. SL43 TaxID=2806348 RepID=UPI001F3C1D33|nr:PqqD family protein [Devosia sp. SL43]UJW87447.1 PqqD family protein [Devosia sp. SL43]